MKTKSDSIKSLFIPFALFALLFLSSCHDEDVKKPSTIDTSAKKEKVQKVLALREDLNFINRFVDETITDVSSEGGRTSFVKATISRLEESAPCADPTEEELADGSVKITLDLGEGCETEDGIVVSGKVIMIFGFNETTFNYALEFIQYSELEGDHQGEVVDGTVSGSFTLDLETLTQEMEQDLVVAYPNGSEAAYKMAQASEMTESGLRVTSLTTSGNFADGGQFSMTVSKTLLYDFSCDGDLPVQGEELLMFQGNTILVSYGNGTCDNEYSVK